MIRLSLLASACLALAAALTPNTHASVVLVDDFQIANVNLTADSTTPIQSLINEPSASAIGGFRDTTVTWMSGPFSLEAQTGMGIMAFSSDTLSTGNFDLFYDGNGSGLGGVDLTGGGMNTFLFVDFVSADADANLTITLEDTTTASASISKSTSMGASTTGFLLTDFAVDLTSIDSIRVNIDGDSDGDYGIDRIYAGVPEPGTIAIWSIFGFGLAIYLRKKRN